MSVPAQTQHETADSYAGVIACLCPRHRVIVCKDGIQWIALQRKNGGAERPRRSLRYFRAREAPMRLAATLCERIDPSAWAVLVTLPDITGGSK